MSAPDVLEQSQDARPQFAPARGSAAACIFCDQPRQKKPSCEKQTWMVCKDHYEVKCPECGGRAYWMEGMKKGNYYLCFQSLACWWRGIEPPNADISEGGGQ